MKHTSSDKGSSQFGQLALAVGFLLISVPESALSSPVTAWGSVYWNFAATNQIDVGATSVYLRQLSYRVGGSGPAFAFVPGGSQLLDNASQSLQLVGVNQPVPAIKSVPGKPGTYASDGPYTFSFVPPIPQNTAKVNAGGGIGVPVNPVSIDIFDAFLRYDSLDGSVTNYKVAVDAALISFFVSPTVVGPDPDFEFAMSNPTETSLHITSLRYLITEVPFSNNTPVGTEGGFQPFSSRFADSSNAVDLPPGSSSVPFEFLGIPLGSWLYVDGTVSEASGEEAAFRYGYAIYAVPEPGTLLLVCPGILTLFAVRRHLARKLNLNLRVPCVL